MDSVVKYLLDHIANPYVFPGFLLSLGWIIWFLLKICRWPHPKLSTMLLYSTSIAIAVDLHLPRIRICTALADRCIDPLIWQRFVADAAFWFIVIYGMVRFSLTTNLNQPRTGGLSA
jgi:hypothetical protein